MTDHCLNPPVAVPLSGYSLHPIHDRRGRIEHYLMGALRQTFPLDTLPVIQGGFPWQDMHSPHMVGEMIRDPLQSLFRCLPLRFISLGLGINHKGNRIFHRRPVTGFNQCVNGFGRRLGGVFRIGAHDDDLIRDLCGRLPCACI